MNASFNSLLWGPQSFCFPLFITICNCRFMHVFIYMMTLITHSHIYYPGRLEASWKKKASFQVWLTIIGPTGEGNGTPLQYSCLENPWMEEPGRLQSRGSLRVRHDWATSLSLFTFMHWRRKWHPTPVFLPGESPGRGAWWAAVCGVAQSRTRLKRLSSSSDDI